MQPRNAYRVQQRPRGLLDYPRGVSEAAAGRCFENLSILSSVRQLAMKGKTTSSAKSKSPSFAASAARVNDFETQVHGVY